MHASGCSLTIRISDNGPGIADEIKANIFDHLFTTKGVGKGTGLGLPIARQIVVEKHSGMLEVNSTLGRGTEFTISLPCRSLARCFSTLGEGNKLVIELPIGELKQG